jgi:hypothetical protein
MFRQILVDCYNIGIYIYICIMYTWVSLGAGRSGVRMPVGSEISWKQPNRPRGPASLLYDGNRASFPGWKRPVRGADHPSPLRNRIPPLCACPTCNGTVLPFLHYTYTYIHIYIHTHIHTYTHTYIHTYIHTHIHTYTHTYIHTYIHISYVHKTSPRPHSPLLSSWRLVEVWIFSARGFINS